MRKVKNWLPVTYKKVNFFRDKKRTNQLPIRIAGLFVEGICLFYVMSLNIFQGLRF
jgi:hypothetical protein